MLDVRYYLAGDGTSPFEEWFADLAAPAAAKVAVALARLEEGNLSNAKPVGAGVLECRIDWGPGFEMMETGMALTKSFKDLVQRRVVSDAAFAESLLREGIDMMLAGDVDAGKAILRDYIKATVGFEKLGEATDTPAKSLIRMFGARGNPQARNLFGVIVYLQKQAGIELHVAPQRR